jgi:hypothetical protein
LVVNRRLLALVRHLELLPLVQEEYPSEPHLGLLGASLPCQHLVLGQAVVVVVVPVLLLVVHLEVFREHPKHL